MAVEADRLALGSGAAQPLFPIRVVAKLTGINPVTIRAWERRYGLVKPERTPGGHRLYSRSDVDRLRSASRLISQGLAISQASRLLDGARTTPASEPARALEHFLERISRLDDEGMTALYEALRMREDSGETAGALVAALPEAIDRLPIVYQRFAEAWAVSVVGSRLQASLPDENVGRVIVCTCSDDRQRTWASLLALLLCETGLRPILLGPLPAGALNQAAAEARCTAIVVAGPGDAPASGRAGFFRGPFGDGHGGTRLDLDLRAAARQVADAVVLAEASL
jgi:DNA-binding transcriptional MerR regulator